MSSKKGKLKILFVRLSPSTFVQRDLKILKKHFDVKEIDFILTRKEPKNTLKTILHMIKGIFWADLTFSWFADYHAYWAVKLSKIFRKKSIVIVGGYEVANIPEMNYGLLLNPKSAEKVKYIFENGNLILTVNDGLKMDALNNLDIDGKNIETLPTGYDHEEFKPYGKKEDIVLTVSVGDNCERVKLKGINTFIESAKFLPNTKFLVNGITGEALEKLLKISPSNVNFIPSLSQEDLIPFYQKSKVYCQLSIREGLPNALCEAMLCECIPIGTDIPGIKTAIGNTGFYVPYGDVKIAVESIRNALNCNNGKDARKRIIEMFPQNKREKILKEKLKKLAVS